MSRAVLGWLAVLLLVAGGTMLALALRQPPTRGGSDGALKMAAEMKMHGPVATERLVGADEPLLTRFELTDRSGKEIGTDNLAGQLHVVSFFFASCPGPCKTQNHKLGELEREFGKQGVKFLAITCDPRHDTPDVLRKYAAENYNAPPDTWFFLTGDLLYTRRIAGEIFGVHLDERSHVERFILVDRTGQIVGRYAWSDDAELQTLKREIRLRLAEKVPADQAPKKTPDEAAADLDEKTPEDVATPAAPVASGEAQP